MTNEEILERLKPICLCSGIRKSVFLKQIAAGINTVEGLQRATGAGNGSCQGKRCTERITDMLNGNAHGQAQTKTDPAARPHKPRHRNRRYR